jgi:hypothetical protein
MLGVEEGSRIKLPIWLPPLKVRNCPNFLVCRWCVTYRWKDLDEGYNFASDFISIKDLNTKFWAPKVTRVIVVGISRLPLGSPRTKWHLGAGLMVKHKVYYKGEGGSFPKFGLWWVLWVWVCSWLVCAPKCSNYALTNLLFGLCRFMWVSELLINFLSPISELQHTPLPSKCCEPRSTPQLFLLPMSSPLGS